MTIEIDVSVAIARPPELVFEVLADFARNPEWQAARARESWR